MFIKTQNRQNGSNHMINSHTVISVEVLGHRIYAHFNDMQMCIAEYKTKERTDVVFNELCAAMCYECVRQQNSSCNEEYTYMNMYELPLE